MSTEFDLDAAVDEVSSGLGLGQVEEIEKLEEPNAREAVAAPEKEETSTEATQEKTATDPTKEGEQKAEETAAPVAKAAPKTWRPDAVKHWETLPEQVKDEILKREQDVFTGINQYKGEAEFGRSIAKSLEPYSAILKQYNVNVPQQISGLMHSHYTLAFGSPEQKSQLIQRLISDYKIDPASIGASKEAAYVDPEVAGLRSEFQRVQSQLQGFVAEKQQEMKQTLEKRIETFATNPANKYFNDVMPEMTQLLKNGVCKTIEEAYEKAIYLNPGVRDKLVAEEYTKRQEAERQRAAEAAKASKPARVVSRQTPGGDTAARGSMDDTLQEAFRAIQSRQS